MQMQRTLIEPQGLTKLELSERRCFLSKNVPTRAPCSASNLCHGQSISLISQESKGSVGVFVSPVDNTEQIYAMTAAHVVPGADSDKVVTPGKLDTLSSLLKIMKSKNPKEEELGRLLTQAKESCGSFHCGEWGQILMVGEMTGRQLLSIRGGMVTTVCSMKSRLF